MYVIVYTTRTNSCTNNNATCHDSGTYRTHIYKRQRCHNT
jgi:hypothetical protein